MARSALSDYLHVRNLWDEAAVVDQVRDGYLIVRHPDLETTLAMADRVGTDLRLCAAP